VARKYLTEAQARTDNVRRNEKIKAFATITGQLWTALFAAAAVRIYDRMAIEGATAFWIVVSFVLIWVTMWSLGKLEVE
jgi:hypothetical protein